MIFRFIAAIIVATWLLWQVPFSATDEIRLPEIAAFSAFSDEPPANGESPAMVFYRRNDVGQYTAYGTGATGAVVRSVRLPGSELKKADDTKISLAGKEGYITGPENGAYYIWYPQIGTQVYVFNEQGSFLWEKEESHYLNALPRGRYILAAAGDHSRMLFMNPDFKLHADFQGVLFTRFIADDNPDLKKAQVCIGSLDGEIVVAHLDRKLYFRHKLGYALKSLQCDFERGELAAIVERSVEIEKTQVQRDLLLRMVFNLQPPKDEKAPEAMRMVPVELDAVSAVELPVRTVTASPLVMTGESACFLQAAPQSEAPDGLALYYTTSRKSALKYTIVLPVASSEMAPDLWRGATLQIGKEQACIFTHRSGRTLIANRRGLLLDRNDLPAERMIARGDAVFLQTATGILTLR
ncbi:MAG: hypothetical protein J0L53_18095 [Spirochaetes bacterium]|nr:hypothetical protein [Spirochaetota bacterium]